MGGKKGGGGGRGQDPVGIVISRKLALNLYKILPGLAGAPAGLFQAVANALGMGGGKKGGGGGSGPDPVAIAVTRQYAQNLYKTLPGLAGVPSSLFNAVANALGVPGSRPKKKKKKGGGKKHP